MIGIIWYHTEEKMTEKIHSMVKAYKEIHYSPVIYAQGGRGCNKTIGFISENQTEDTWTLIPDTTTFYTKKQIENSKGCNVALIDKDISLDFQNEIIFPLLKLPPYQAYYYF